MKDGPAAKAQLAEADSAPIPKSASSSCPPEIWVKVLSYLRKPIPLPNSRPPRSEMHQQDLTATARVCKVSFSLYIQKRKLMNQALEWDLQYPLIQTCPHRPLCSFIADARSSRRNVLRLTERIYVEYPEEPTSISYSSILRFGSTADLWDLVAPVSRAKIIQAGQMEDELWVQTLSIGVMALRAGPIADICPKLQTVAISSIYGRLSDRWMLLRKEEKNLPKGILTWKGVDACGKMWTQFVIHGKLKHMCNRDGGGGPLAGQTTVHPSRLPSLDHLVPGLTIHVNEDIDKFDFKLGAKTTWVSDTPSTHQWCSIYGDIAQSLEMIANRTPADLPGCHPNSNAVSLDIYSSTPIVENPRGLTQQAVDIRKLAGQVRRDYGEINGKALPVAIQRRVAAKLAEKHQKELRSISGIPHSIRWFPAADAPICPACGSSAPP